MIRREERERTLQADSIGPKMIDYLEMIGIESLADLRDLSAEELQTGINHALGRQHINEAGRRALENLILLSQDC